MSKKSLFATFVFTALFVSGAALNSQARSTAAPPADAPAAAVSCNQVVCHSNDDCGFPDVCGGCIRSSGQFFGHCAPTP
jgi:hypothetical protein